MTGGDPIDQLWRHCIEHRDDDASRGVLADMLQATGDPRGELFTLQLLPADSDNAPARRARIRELVAEHGRVWLGPLHEYARGASFERGMVTRLELIEALPVMSPNDRELWSVEELVVGRSAIRTLRRILTCPAAHSIRRLAVDDLAVIDVIAACTQPLVHLACLHPFDGSNRTLTNRFLTIAGRRESITSLGMWAEGIADLRQRDWFDRIEHLRIACSMRRGLALWRTLPAHTSLTIATWPGLDTCERTFPSDCQLELRRDGSARVSGEWLLQPLSLLDELPPEITRLELEDTSEPIVERIRIAVGATREITLRGLVGRAGNLRW